MLTRGARDPLVELLKRNTSMDKPIIFFSHSTKDKKQLVRLKELFVQKTGGSIDVFLSSDGQSIPLGRNWVHAIQEALRKAKLMIVFISSNSLRSSWTYFESGFAYSKDIRVVPVGFLGVDLATLSPPISLLQGFNITSKEGLNNIVALANDAFNHSHDPNFSDEEYQMFVPSSLLSSSNLFGDYAALVQEIKINLNHKNGIEFDCATTFNHIVGFLDKNKIEHTTSDDKTINFHGVSIYLHDIKPFSMEIMIDSEIADTTLPIIEKVIKEIRSLGINGISARFEFIHTVNCLTTKHKITGRIYGSDVKLRSSTTFVLGDIEFQFEPNYRFESEGYTHTGVHLDMTFHCNEIPTSQISNLIQFLFNQEILYALPETFN